ncbi:MAG: DoxX family protein [Flavobacteriaceae bacterium]|nr:DoxX family protein [Flavobacteriaceae bacterium]|tara:strand:- start:1696 stop:2061 length:366 start_codon:yes stop_codon:yes gene_type:complete
MKTHLSLLINRVAFSLLMLTHGYPKLVKLFSENPTFGNPLGIGEIPTLILAVLAEFIAPIFIIIGYKTRIFTIFPIITMFVAAFVVHLDDPFKRKELAIVYLFAFLIIFLMGPGKYSFDKK